MLIYLSQVRSYLTINLIRPVSDTKRTYIKFTIHFKDVHFYDGERRLCSAAAVSNKLRRKRFMRNNAFSVVNNVRFRTVKTAYK